MWLDVTEISWPGTPADCNSSPASRTGLLYSAMSGYTFLHPAARILFDDWEGQLRGCVTHLRALSSLEPDAPDVAMIVGELVMKSPEFARLWHRYDVRAHNRGRKSFHHPDVGDLDLGYQSMSLNGTPGQALIAYYAKPGTAEHDALTLLDRADIDRVSVSCANGSDP